MDITHNGGDLDPTGFADTMSKNCNGIQNHENDQESLVLEEAPAPTYADAFPPLPTTPGENGTSTAPAVKWGKGEPAIAKTAMSNLTQVIVRSLFLSLKVFA